MRKLFITVFSALLAVGVYAQTQGAVLSQLGARGITHESDGSADYRNYLVLLDGNGQLDTSLFAASPGATASLPLNNLYYIDINGTNSANSGAITRPFQTFAYALTQISTNSIFIFGPGEHDGAGTAISNPDIRRIILIGYDPLTTKIGAVTHSLAFANSQASHIDIAGITVDKIQQENNVETTIKAYSGAILTDFARTYATNIASHTTLYTDPSATVPTLAGNYTHVESHDATRIGYTPGDTNDWLVVPITVQEGLDTVASFNKLPTGMDIGSLTYWNGTNWVTAGTGATHQVLFGGATPGFGDLTLAGDVTGPPTNTVIADNAVTTNKLDATVLARILTALNITNIFAGDVIGTYDATDVVRVQGKAVDAPTGAEDQMLLIYDLASDKFIYTNGVPSWSLYPALQDVDFDDNNLTNVMGITLGGIYRTNWPTLSATSEDWSGHPATQTVDMANFGLTNVSDITFGGVHRTNWPAISDTPAVGDVDLDNNNITNVFGLTLGGEYRTSWPTAVSWSTYAALQSVNFGGFNLTNIGGITLDGVTITAWPNPTNWSAYAAAQDVNMANHNLTNVFGLTLGGVYRTNWPAVSTWSTYSAIQDVDIDGNELTNVFAMTLGGTRRTTWPVGTGGDTWSGHAATQNVDIASNLLLNVGGIDLGGTTRTTWPTASNWATYPATVNPNIANKGLQNVQFITLGGVTRTTWPVEITDWYAYPASNNVDIGGNALTNVTAIELNGSTIVVWPISATEWAGYSAVTNIDMDSFNVDNIGKLKFNGWSISTIGGDLVFSNTASTFIITDAGKLKQEADAGDKYVLVSDTTGVGSWTNSLNLYSLVLTNNNLMLPDGANTDYIWTSTDTSGAGYWAPYAQVSITNEADPVAMAALSNYYWTAIETETYIQANYYTKSESDASFAATGHNHDTAYSAIFHNHDLWYANKNHLHTGVYSPVAHNHYGSYISGAMTNTWGAAVTNYGVNPSYGWMLYWVNPTTTYWGPAPSGGSGTNWGTNHVSSLSVGPQYMEKPEIVSIYQADGAAISLAASYVTNTLTRTRSPSSSVIRNTNDLAITPEYGAVIDGLYANIVSTNPDVTLTNAGGIRTLNMHFDIPDLSYVIGLEVSVRYRKGSASADAPCYVVINNNGYMSETNSFSMSAITDTTVTVGSATSVWGLTSIHGGPLAGWDVNQNDFSVELFTTGTPGNSYLIDGVLVKAYYVHHITSYNMGVTTNNTWYLKHKDYDPVLEATPTRVRIPYGTSPGWVLTCIDTNGTAQWQEPTGGSTSTPSAILLSGVHTPTGLVNTVTFTNTFTSGVPTVVAGWLNSDVDELAVVSVLSRTANSFNYEIRNSAGVMNTNWVIGWIASDPVLLSGQATASTWSTQPAIQNVNMNSYGLNNVSYIQLGTNAPITWLPETRTVSFAMQYPEVADELTAWRSPYNITLTRFSGAIRGGAGTEVGGRLEWHHQGYAPVVVLDNIVIGTNDVTTTTFDTAANDANGWLYWTTTNVVGDVGQIAITVDYTID